MSEQVWILDDDDSIRFVLFKALQKAKFSCAQFARPFDLLNAIKAGAAPQLIISDVRMPDMDGLTLLEEIHQHLPDLPVIIMTAHSDLDSAVNAYQKGAFEYLPKPFDIQEAIALVGRAIEASTSSSTKAPNDNIELRSSIIGEAPAMQEVFRAIGRLSSSSVSVLINGQSGTGKELVASALHTHSPRKNKPFVALNMAAIPHELIESELFGHAKGSFTGAQGNRQGRFAQADGGTLFLDEIGDMPLSIQTRLLRVLADGQFYPVGSMEAKQVDVRIVAATHQNLMQLVKDGKFREDLYHRLNVIRIELPALCERATDIPLLIHFFLKRVAHEMSVSTKHIHPDCMQFLQTLPWPGNVRQLENFCRWVSVMVSNQEVMISDLPQELLATNPTSNTEHTLRYQSWQHGLQAQVEQHLQNGDEHIATELVAEVEKILIDTALKHTHGHRQDAAKHLGWGRNTITRKIKELGLEE